MNLTPKNDKPADSLPPGLIIGPDGQHRCWWHGNLPDYLAYHDHEWGYPVSDDRRLFEKLCLEGFQSGLSWLTILRKRENFRAAFAKFDIEQVAQYGEREILRCLADAGIVRHRGKIEATIANAKAIIEIQKEFGSFAAFIWRFDTAGLPGYPSEGSDYDALLKRSQTETSTKMSHTLKKYGCRFVGPTTAYAFMQAMGLVNDHLQGCKIRPAIEGARKKFNPPQPR